MNETPRNELPSKATLIDQVIRFCLENKLVVLLLTIFVICWGILVAPFDWKVPGQLPRNPVPVDAIPDIGENQQIVFTEWTGRSPQDVEDQISYPLSVSLLDLPRVKTIRSFSMFGFSLVYVIFEDGVDFYWARTRVLESLSSVTARDLPEGSSNFGFFVVFHTGYDIAFPGNAQADVERVRTVAKEFKELTIVTTHVGGWRQWDRAGILGSCENVYTETDQ